jgi:hypothetical protein
MYTNQEIFDKVARHLIAQGERSRDESNGSCKYRMQKPDGRLLKCAVGILISDEDYDWTIEGVVVSLLPAEILSKFTGPGQLALLDRLQTVHDSCFTNVAEFKKKMREVARQCSLSPAVLDADDQVHQETQDAPNHSFHLQGADVQAQLDDRRERVHPDGECPAPRLDHTLE